MFTLSCRVLPGVRVAGVVAGAEMVTFSTATGVASLHSMAERNRKRLHAPKTIFFMLIGFNEWVSWILFLRPESGNGAPKFGDVVKWVAVGVHADSDRFGALFVHAHGGAEGVHRRIFVVF